MERILLATNRGYAAQAKTACASFQLSTPIHSSRSPQGPPPYSPPPPSAPPPPYPPSPPPPAPPPPCPPPPYPPPAPPPPYPTSPPPPPAPPSPLGYPLRSRLRALPPLIPSGLPPAGLPPLLFPLELPPPAFPPLLFPLGLPPPDPPLLFPLGLPPPGFPPLLFPLGFPIPSVAPPSRVLAATSIADTTRSRIEERIRICFSMSEVGYRVLDFGLRQQQSISKSILVYGGYATSGAG
ncbi:hypothetical protein PC9H_001369 [Pleurotus ostreatus]|uniref:Uncharacterized protein n=1 Tax=Pleurotus ostreatus TaxID=5322 RepID=A0A8H7DXQ3_PLEOS|nr:uncharacterized protein PC9H_001369 [Pleurotus ostreatus]KAF7441020.1 hypothetical protein PC9H_001369 [Pleurotus ostreatus]